MRILAMAIVAIAMVSAAGPARAQRYDPAFPFCMYLVEWGGSPRYDCSFTTMNQCRATAGLGGSCDRNPYSAGETTSPGRHSRQRRVY